MKRKANRILAVEIRAGRIGYAVFETPLRLLDFGATWFNSSSVARLRLKRLLRACHPSTIVLRRRSKAGLRRNLSFASLAKPARSEASQSSAAVTQINERAFKAFYEHHNCRNKYDVAAFLANTFPETAWRLPPRRKSYNSEPRSIIYFDSVAVGMAYLETEVSNNKSNEDEAFLSASKQ